MNELILNIVPILLMIVNAIMTYYCLGFKWPWLFSVCIWVLGTIIVFAVFHFMKSDMVLLRALLYFPIILIIYNGCFLKKISVFFLQVFTMRIIFAIANILVVLSGVDGANPKFNNFVTINVFFLLLLYLIVFLLYGKKILNKAFNDSSDKDKEWLLYSFNMVLSVFCMHFLTVALVDKPGILALVILVAMSNVILLFFTIINVRDKAKFQYESEFAQSVISAEKKHHKEIVEMYQAISILRHDYKFHLKTINNMLNAGNIEEIKQLLSSIDKDMPQESLQNYCANPTLNALLSNYAERCAKFNIKYNVQIELPEVLCVPNYEMCVILGNLLENAVDACQKLDSGREIELSIKTQGSLLAIMTKNTFNCMVVETDNQLASTKESSGLGLRSVKTIAARHNGYVSAKWDERTFTIYVMLGG